LIYKLVIRETELHPQADHYGFVKEPITIVVRHQNFTRKNEGWKNDIIQWAWQTLGHRNWDWNVLETITPFRDQAYFNQRHREELFFLFEEKGDATLTKLAHGGTVIQLHHASIEEYLKNGEPREIQAD
jgi:hypothetical protein